MSGEFENYLAGKWLFRRKKDTNNDGLYVRIKTGGTVVEREIVTQAVSPFFYFTNRKYLVKLLTMD
ncbi:MAG: hypothetical protein WBL44_06610 [Nitrososphaeraceae archaeon]|jgi:hypothetical protein